MTPRFSIVIPARDEEHYLPICLDSIEQAAAPYPGQVEVVVVVNRCTDRTEEIARSRGAVVVHDDSKCLATIRNAGIRTATGEILLTIDADSAMSPGLLQEVERLLDTGKFIGGATRFTFDRLTLGLILLLVILTPILILLRVGSACFWCLRKDFWEIGGFDESRISFEDVDFAQRLKKHGKKQGKRFKVLFRSYVTTSARKFILLRRDPRVLFTLLRGVDRETANRLWYETPREKLPGATKKDSE